MNLRLDQLAGRGGRIFSPIQGHERPEIPRALWGREASFSELSASLRFAEISAPAKELDGGL
jgi:hypothetical protein